MATLATITDIERIKDAAKVYCGAVYGTLKEEPLIAETFIQGALWALNNYR